jgi:hypothetical protein
MELVFILFMLGGGVALAVFVMAAMAVARRGEEIPSTVAGSARDSVAASLLFHVLRAGGSSAEDALRRIRRGTGIAAPVTQGIDVASWAETFARDATAAQRTELLERAVQLVAEPGKPVPLRQYAALLDLSFGLGFQTDALARLRSVYGFDYVDHARDARLRSASSDGFVRLPERVDELFAVLGIAGSATRQELGSAYRRLVVQHHPDRFHGATPEVREAAAMKFIEITRAYEKLLLTIRD